MSPGQQRPHRGLPTWRARLALLLAVTLGAGTAAAVLAGSRAPGAADAERACQEFVAHGLDAPSTAAFGEVTTAPGRVRWTVHGQVEVAARAGSARYSYACTTRYEAAVDGWETTANWTPEVPGEGS